MHVLGSVDQNETLRIQQTQPRLEASGLRESPVQVHEEPRPVRMSLESPSDSATQG